MKKIIILIILFVINYSYSTDTGKEAWGSTCELVSERISFSDFTIINGKEITSEVILSLSSQCNKLDEYRKIIDDLKEQHEKIEDLNDPFNKLLDELCAEVCVSRDNTLRQKNQQRNLEVAKLELLGQERDKARKLLNLNIPWWEKSGDKDSTKAKTKVEEPKPAGCSCAIS